MPSSTPEAGGKENLGAVDVPVVPALAEEAAIPPSLNPPPRDSPPVVAVTEVAPKVNPEVGLPPTLPFPSVNPDEAEEAGVVAPPNVNAVVGFTEADAVVFPAPSVKPCDGADPKVNPPTWVFGMPNIEPESPVG